MNVWPFKKKQREERSSPHMAGWPGGRVVETGTYLNPLAAENLSVVMACVSAISTAIAALPALVYKQNGKTRLEAPEHALTRLIQSGPNPYQTWPDMVEFIVAQTLLFGNSLTEIVADGRGQVVELRPVPWPNVSVQMLPSGRLAYDVYEVTRLYGGTSGRRRRLLAEEVLHLRDRSNDGLVGVSRLQRAFGAVKTATNIAEASSATFENGVFPSGAIETPETLNADQRRDLGEAYSRFNQGPTKTGRVMILDRGLSWKQLTISPIDAEMLASRRFSVEEICRVFGTPPPIVQSYEFNTFTNAEVAGRWFAQFTLMPWLRKLEAEFSRALFAGTPFALELDMSGYDRGDSATRWAAHKIAIEAGVLTPDEIREQEGWNPRPGPADIVSQASR